jgi:hypothetical protein
LISNSGALSFHARDFSGKEDNQDCANRRPKLLAWSRYAQSKKRALYLAAIKTCNPKEKGRSQD